MVFWLVACVAECPPIGCPPPELARFSARTRDSARSEMASGHLLLTQLTEQGPSFASVIDGAGNHLWWWSPERGDHKVLRARLARDGDSVLVGLRNQDNDKLDGALVRVDRKRAEVSGSIPVSDHHHEHVELPDGRIAYLSRRRVADQWIGSEFPVATDVVLAVDLDAGGEPELVFDLLELGVTPTWICGHMRPDGFLEGALDWSHTNSMVVDPQTGGLTLGVRHFDAVARVEPDGTLRWWLGEPPGLPGVLAPTPRPELLQPVDGAQSPVHGHFGEAWSDGLLVFDNGNHTGRPSRVVEYAIDEQARTYREIWSYEHPAGLTFNARGDAVRLPGGNVLIAWSGQGRIWEVTPDGEIVWEADTDQKVSRMQFVESW